MRIGDVAKAAGCSARAIRHYHVSGALAEPRRDASGYRSYSVGDVAAVLRIRALVEAGVPLRLIGNVGAGVVGENGDGEGRGERGRDKEDRNMFRDALAALDARIGELTSRRNLLLSILDGTFGVPDDVVSGVRTVLGGDAPTEDRAAYVSTEVDALQLMAFAGVTTDETWDVIRENLGNPARVSASRAGAAAWLELGTTEAEAPSAGELAEAVVKGRRDGILSGIEATLRPGEVPLVRADIPLRGAQAAIFDAMVDEWQRSAAENGTNVAGRDPASVATRAER